jgi:FlaA1/EpsC-like NDP-sugar epimerase
VLDLLKARDNPARHPLWYERAVERGRPATVVLHQGLLLVLLDLVAIAVSGFGAAMLRFDWTIPSLETQTVLMFVLLAIPVKLAALWIFKLYKLDRRYVGTYDALNVFRACSLATLALGALSFLVLVDPRLPRSVLVMDFILTLGGIGAIRAWPRAWHAMRGSHAHGERTVLIVGAGHAGASLTRDMKSSPDFRATLVGLIDDNPAKRGTYIHGVKVLGDRTRLPTIMSSQHVDEVFIAMPSASGAVIQETVTAVRKAGVSSIRIVPDLDAVLSGRVTTSNVREVRVEDVLNRTPPPLDVEAISRMLRGDTVLVTGAAGSIGSELCRHLARLPVGRLVMLDQNESGIFDLERELRRLPGSPEMDGIVADIRDPVRIRRVLFEARPKVVFHAAAYKHVPLMEMHPREAVRTNTLGTAGVARESAAAGVDTFVLISTDKAVNPTSVMGATKRAAEIVLRNLFPEDSTRFVALRFGNVLGSRGSLIPVMQEQIRAGGPITITNPDMERYIMTSTEAVFLILSALLEAENGDILLLDMGQPIRLMELVQAVTRLAGLEPDQDIPIAFIGARPGEKQCEELVGTGELLHETSHAHIHRVQDDVSVEAGWVTAQLSRLEDACLSGDRPLVRAILRELVPTYEPAGLVELPDGILQSELTG